MSLFDKQKANTFAADFRNVFFYLLNDNIKISIPSKSEDSSGIIATFTFEKKDERIFHPNLGYQ